MAVIVGGRVNNVNSIINNLQHLSSRAKRRISDTYTVSPLERGLGVCYFTYYGTFKQYSIMETKNGKRVLLSDDELKEVSGGWIIFAIPCKDYKEKKKCEEKGCVWSESGKCKNE